jgi:hypothetical protein
LSQLYADWLIIVEQDAFFAEPLSIAVHLTTVI